MPTLRRRLNKNALAGFVRQDRTNLTVSRRELFAGGAVAVASLSPGVRAAVSAIGTGPISVSLVRKGKAIVSGANGASWTIDTASFSGSPLLTVEKGATATKLKLTGARFPGTAVALNFEATVPHLSSGKIEIRFFDCGDGSASFRTTAKIGPWLAGEASATGAISKDALAGLFNTLHKGAGADSVSKGTIAYLATGQLVATAPMDLVTDDELWAISTLALSTESRTADTIVSGRDKNYTVVSATKRDDWSGKVAMESASGWQVSGSADAFDTIVAECHEGGEVATNYSGGGALDLVLPGVAALRTKSPSLTSLGTGEDLHFASMLHDDGSWIHHQGVSLHAAPVADEPFILSTNKRGELLGEPVLTTRQVAANLDDAIVTFTSPLVPNLTISTGQGRPPIIQRPPVTQKPPITTIPKDTLRPIIASTQVWIPSIEVVRPEDFLCLKFEFANLHLVTSPVGTPYFERETPSRPAYIIVEFPPQSIGEQTHSFGSNYKSPVRTLLSGPTRLVFYIPSVQKTVKFSLTEAGGLLDWSAWSLSVAPAAFSTFSGKVSIDPSWQHPIEDLKIGANREFELFAERSPTVSERLASLFKIQRQTTDQTRALPLEFQLIRQKPMAQIHLKPNVRDVKPQIDPTKIIPGIPRGRTGPVYRYNTNIEIPAMMQMSPDENAHFFHVRSIDSGPIRIGAGRKTALWHTRLGTFASINGQTYRAESSDDGEWFYMQDSEGKLGPYKSTAPIHPTLRAVDATDYDAASPLANEFSINPAQRKSIVDSMTLRSNDPSSDVPPFVAERLMLTSLGGFLKGSWHWAGGKPPPHNVTDWTHWSTLGREQYVEIVEVGFLYPTGHPAIMVSISQRKFVPSGQGVVAELVKKIYVRVTGPTVNFEPDVARKLGFSQITCKTKTTPDIIIDGVLSYLQGTTIPYEFSFVGADMDGRSVSWTQQCEFIKMKQGLSETTNWDGAATVQAHMGGQPIAFAPSQHPSDGTVFPCVGYTMRAIHGPPNFENGTPAFRPTMMSAMIHVPAVDQYLPSGANVGAVAVMFDDGYKAGGFNGGAEVFLKLSSPISAECSDGKKFGGMINPAVKMEVISRKHGPIPAPSGSSVKYAMVASEEFASLDSEMLAPDMGKLLGVVSIWDLLPSSIDLGGNGADAPKFKVAKVFSDDKFGAVGSGNPNSPLIGAVSSFSWQPTLGDWAPAAWPFSQKVFTKYGGQAQLRIDAAYYQITDAQGSSFPAGSSYYLKAGIYNFQINACDQVHILVQNIEFSSQTGSNSSVKVDIADIQFVNMLSFVGVLQSILAPGKKGYHFQSSVPNAEILASTEVVPFGLGIEPILDIDGNGLTVGFSLSIPTIGIGVVTVMNIAVLSEMILPWFGDALTFRFAFCKRDAPFAVSVYGIAGGGFLGIELTPKGIKTIEGSIEFGAMVALNFGVASGSISLMAGFYFKYETEGGTTLTGYVRLVGEVDVLGLISASLEMYLGLSYNTSSQVLSGDASISVRISLFCFHKTVTISTHKEFAGSSGSAELGSTWASTSPPALYDDHDRTLYTRSVTSQQFKNYCSAFGGNA